MIIRRKRKRVWRTDAPERVASTRKAHDAAREALPSPRPGTPAHAIWRDVLGLADRPPEPLPRTAEEAANYLDPHERLSRASAEFLGAINAAGRGNARKAARSPAANAKRATHEAVFSACAVELKPPYTKECHAVIKAAMRRVRVTPTDTAVDTFLRWKRREDAARRRATPNAVHAVLLAACEQAGVRTLPPFSRKDTKAIFDVMRASTVKPTPKLAPFLEFLASRPTE